MTLKEQIRQYLEKRYSQTRWPNIYLVEMVREFGPETINTLNELWSEGIVSSANGIRGKLVIYTEDPEEIELNKKQFSNRQT